MEYVLALLALVAILSWWLVGDGHRDDGWSASTCRRCGARFADQSGLVHHHLARHQTEAMEEDR